MITFETVDGFDRRNVVAPVVPNIGAPVTVEQMEDAEQAIAIALPSMNDIRVIQDQCSKIKALEKYLEGKQAHLPARGAQRRLEARIGQLLGEPEVGRPEKTSVMTEVSDVSRHERMDFRILARALNGECELSKTEWRQSRRALVALIKDRTKEDTAMDPLAAFQERMRKPATQIQVPEGKTPEQVTREGIALERQGSSDKAAKAIGVRPETYSRMRDIVLLADRDDLSEDHAEIASTALKALNETRRVVAPYELIAPIAKRVWGEERKSRTKAEAQRLEQFDYAMKILEAACTESASLEVPYITEERQANAVMEIEGCITHLRTLLKNIKEARS